MTRLSINGHLQCYPCSDSICLGSVSPSPKVAQHKSHPEQEIAPEAPRHRHLSFLGSLCDCHGTD